MSLKEKIIFLLNYIVNYRFKALNPFLLKVALSKRFKVANTKIYGKKVSYVDSASFISIYDEVFNRELYKFNCSKKNPVIIDCGANIGLSVLYFKKMHPNSFVIAFEPDEKIFSVLKTNVESQNITSNTTLINKGLWNEETTLYFSSDGADGGHISLNNESENKIETTCLSKHINSKVDLLKIDIEGAEIRVLEETKHKLNLVENLFVEYHSFNNQKQELNKLLQILSEAGFRYHIQHTGRFSKQPFIKRRLMGNMDLQLNIFAYRN